MTRLIQCYIIGQTYATGKMCKWWDMKLSILDSIYSHYSGFIKEKQKWI